MAAKMTTRKTDLTGRGEAPVQARTPRAGAMIRLRFIAQSTLREGITQRRPRILRPCAAFTAPAPDRCRRQRAPAPPLTAAPVAAPWAPRRNGSSGANVGGKFPITPHIVPGSLEASRKG